MPDQDQTGFSRVCPSCGRRVPRNVAKCRCGAELPAESPATLAADISEEPTTGSSSLAAIIVAVLVIGAAGYWFFLRSSPATTRSERAAADDSAPAAESAAPAGPSAERRAWDAAAANANNAPPPGKDADPETASSTPAPLSASASTEEMVARVMPAIVLIETTTGRGSGFFVRHDTLITNVHVV